MHVPLLIDPHRYRMQKLLGSEFWKDEETKSKVTLTTNSGVHCSVIPPYVIAIVTNLFLGLYKNFESHLVRHKWERQNGFYMRELAGSTFGICECTSFLFYYELTLTLME